MFGFKKEAKFSPPRDISFVQSVRDAATFHLCLSFAASHIEAMRESEVGIQSMMHKGTAISIINRRLNDPVASVSGGTIFAVITLMRLEVIYAHFWSTWVFSNITQF
jgi:hypothetical protein